MAPQVCSPWLTPEGLCCAGETTVAPCDGSDPVEQTYPFCDEDYIMAASNILFARTCFLYPGICEASIWPCIDNCHMSPYPCRNCCGPAQIELPVSYPVSNVVITEDGVPLDPADYRVERQRFVVRLDGLHFARNNFGIGEGTETIITYDYGRTPPVELVMAAADLACELKKACSGDGDCRLPPHVRSVSRQGLQIEMVDLQRMLMSDKTGIPTVDYALSIHGHCSGTLFGDPAAGPLGWGPAS